MLCYSHFRSRLFQYGLYAAYMGCFMYMLLGSTRAITIGPTALMALITYETSTALGPQGAIVLTFFTGIIILALGLLNLGRVLFKCFYCIS